jgi:acetoin utilization protein AcuB
MTIPKTIREIMSTELKTIGPNEDLATALVRMRQAEVRRLPVLDAEGQLRGILTDRDLRLAADSPFLDESPADAFEQLRHHTVAEIMTTSITTIEPEAKIVEAAKLMRVAHIGGLPVVENDETLVGIVTRSDLLDHLIRLLEPTVTEE